MSTNREKISKPEIYWMSQVRIRGFESRDIKYKIVPKNYTYIFNSPNGFGQQWMNIINIRNVYGPTTNSCGYYEIH